MARKTYIRMETWNNTVAGWVTITGDLTSRKTARLFDCLLGTANQNMSDLQNKSIGTRSILKQMRPTHPSFFCANMPGFHRRCNHPRWVLIWDLTTVEEPEVWVPIEPTEPKQPTSEQKSQADSTLTFFRSRFGMHTWSGQKKKKNRTERDVQSDSHSLTYGLGPGQQLEARCLLRTAWAVSLALNFPDTRCRVRRPDLTDCSHTGPTQKAIYSKT